MPTREITFVALGKLRPSDRNCRTHSKQQIRQLANSIAEFGWTCPLLVDEEFRILAGHARYSAALLLQCREVPVVVIGGLSSAKKRALAIADNKIASNAGWNLQLLREELIDLAGALPEIDLTLEIAGFEASEIESLLGEPVGPKNPARQSVARHKTKQTAPRTRVSKVGDLWELGPHKILVGNALTAEDVRRLIATRSAAMLIVGSPLPEVQGLGRRRTGALTPSSGDVCAVRFAQFMHQSLAHSPDSSERGVIHFVLVDWPKVEEPYAAGVLLAAQLADVAIRRWQALTQGEAVLATTGQTFACVAAAQVETGSAP